MLNISKSKTFKILCLTIFGLSQSLVHSIVTTLEGKDVNGNALPKIEVEWQYFTAHDQNWAALKTISSSETKYRSPNGLKKAGYDLSHLPSNAEHSIAIMPFPCHLTKDKISKEDFFKAIDPELKKFCPEAANPHPLPEDGSVGKGCFNCEAATKLARECLSKNAAVEIDKLDPKDIPDYLKTLKDSLRGDDFIHDVFEQISNKLTKQSSKDAIALHISPNYKRALHAQLMKYCRYGLTTIFAATTVSIVASIIYKKHKQAEPIK